MVSLGLHVSPQHFDRVVLVSSLLVPFWFALTTKSADIDVPGAIQCFTLLIASSLQ
jgi:hypothetical protein